MKFTTQISVAGIVILVGAFVASAQTNPVVSSEPVRSGTVVVPERPTAVDANITATSTIRPQIPERKEFPPEVRARIEQFKFAMRKYLDREEALKKQLQGANDQQRAALRQQLKDLRETWLDQAREMRKEFKDRLAELSVKLPDHAEVLDSIRENKPTQLQGAREHSRRGND